MRYLFSWVGLSIAFSESASGSPAEPGTLVQGRLPGPTVIRGVLYGLPPWLVVQVVVMPMMGMEFFSGAFALAFGSLIGHIIYGAVVGVVYSSASKCKTCACQFPCDLCFPFRVPVSTTHVSCGALFGIGAATSKARLKTISGIKSLAVDHIIGGHDLERCVLSAVTGGGRMSQPIPSFENKLTEHHISIARKPLEILQINVGRLCNQACHHCHVEAGPKLTEIMEKETVDRLIELMDQSSTIHTVDITGGAPELNPHFRYLVTAARQRGKEVIDRCNLTVFFEKGQEKTAYFLKAHQVKIVASLPCYSKKNVDAQRGGGVFDKSIRALRLLNELGYGKINSEQSECEGEAPMALPVEGATRAPMINLELDLVYNPLGAFLPFCSQKCHLIGADAPQLSRDLILKAHHILRGENKFVIGPARDGGFYLFGGAKALPKHVWTSVTYSQPSTCDELVAKIKNYGEVVLLPTLSDADVYEDFPLLVQELQTLKHPTQRDILNWIENTLQKEAQWA